MRSEILRLSVNSLTANDKYSPDNRENFSQQIEMHISQKPKTFSEFFIALWQSTSNFPYLEKKDESHSLSIFEIIDCERGGYLKDQKGPVSEQPLAVNVLARRKRW